MKTLDEVIETIGFCKSGDLSRCKECSYIGTCELDYAVLSDDALHYLREYKNKAHKLDIDIAEHHRTFEQLGVEIIRYQEAVKNCEEALHKYQEIEDEYEELKDWFAEEHVENVPLSWDELRTMEGKPVWVEDEDSYSRWEIINGVYDFGISFGDYYLNKNEFGTVWQAYRKERK